MRVSVCVCVCVCVCVEVGVGGEGSTFWSTSCHDFLNYFSGGGVEWGGLIRAARGKHIFARDSRFCASRSRKHSYLNSS